MIESPMHFFATFNLATVLKSYGKHLIMMYIFSRKRLKQFQYFILFLFCIMLGDIKMSFFSGKSLPLLKVIKKTKIISLENCAAIAFSYFYFLSKNKFIVKQMPKKENFKFASVILDAKVLQYQLISI